MHESLSNSFVDIALFSEIGDIHMNNFFQFEKLFDSYLNKSSGDHDGFHFLKLHAIRDGQSDAWCKSIEFSVHHYMQLRSVSLNDALEFRQERDLAEISLPL